MHHSRRLPLRSLPAAVVFALLFVYGGVYAREETAQSQPVRVLFIGNSYTYFNNLPEILAKLGDAGRQVKVETRMIAPGGWRLKDHLEKGEAPVALQEGTWDYVVLQEQSTLGYNLFVEGKPRVSSTAIFEPSALKWAAEIRKAGAKPVFFLTWARKASPEDQAALDHAYMHVARASGSLVAPVGIAWEQVRRDHPEIELYSGDGSHPSPAGTYLAACVFYAAVFRKSPVGLPERIVGAPVNLNTALVESERKEVLVDLSGPQARSLQAAAWNAWQKIDGNGGYLEVPAAPAPSVPPLPAGRPLSSAGLEGTWSGSLLFYPPPFLPLEMTLRIHREGGAWKGHLELNFHSPVQADRSFDLSDLAVKELEITFTDPKGWQNLRVQFHGASTGTNELRGIAEASVDSPDSPIRLEGTWELHKR